MPILALVLLEGEVHQVEIRLMMVVEMEVIHLITQDIGASEIIITELLLLVIILIPI